MIPDLRTLTLPQMALAAVAVVVVLAVIREVMSGGRTRSGSGFLVWVIVPFLVAICGLGAWLLVQLFKGMGPDF